MALADHKIVVYKKQPDGWVAEIPAIPGCYALVDTPKGAIAELAEVFRMIEEERGT